MVFFSYRTKRESPAGDQIWKFSCQCSIFGRIGDQWVAISSPDWARHFLQGFFLAGYAQGSLKYSLCSIDKKIKNQCTSVNTL